MGKKLNTYVWVDDVRYGPDKQPTAAAARKITNPDVWEDVADDEPDPADDPPHGGENRGTGEGDDNPLTDPNRPPNNASREKWAKHATDLDIEVNGQMSRDDIRLAVDAHQANPQA